MLKSVFCRLNTITSRNFIRVSGKLSAIEYQSNKRNGRTNDRSTGYGHVIAFTSLPTFLAFFQTKDDEQPPELEPTFWDKILPEDIALLIKKKPVEDETTPEGKLKTTLKRTILAIRKKEFDKAEQMAHLALRMAQDIKHYDGITLCYDVMANLAFDREQYQKAEKLFESVLQRLLQKGVPQDDIQVLHLSLKLAQLVDLQGKKDEAKTNYAWTVKKLDEKCEKEPEFDDLLELRGLANSFYAKFLSKQGKPKEAFQRLKVSQEIFIKVRGKYEREYVDIINDLAVLSLQLKDYDSAHKYIDEAIILASAYPEMIETGIYHANKALICMKTGDLEDAERLCKHAKKASERSLDPDGIEQVKYCMEQLEKVKKKKNSKFLIF